MEEEKIQRLHDTLSKLRKGKGLGTDSHYSWNAHESISMKKDKDGNLFREDGLPVNGLYSNFVKQGTFDPEKAKDNSALKYGDGRKIRRNFDDIKSVGEEESSDQSSKKSSKKSKEEKKAEKKAAKLEAKKQAKLEEKKRQKVEAKKAAKKTQSDETTNDDATSLEGDRKKSKKKEKKAKKEKENANSESASSSKRKRDSSSSGDKGKKSKKKKDKS